MAMRNAMTSTDGMITFIHGLHGNEQYNDKFGLDEFIQSKACMAMRTAMLSTDEMITFHTRPT